MNTIIFSVGVPVPGEGMGNHAYYLIQGLNRHKLLAKAFVMQWKPDSLIDSTKIRDLYVTERIAYKVARFTHSNQYVLRDNLFDLWVSHFMNNADIFYGWTHHALWSLKKAKKAGMITILERANSHPLTYSRLLRDEYTKHGIHKEGYHPLILKKHLQELERADYIAVTSQFTRHSLLEHGIDDSRILLTPLGVDSEHFTPGNAQNEGKMFRVVYVGQMCFRKGVHYLLEAWHKLRLRNAELWLIGDMVDEMQGILDEYRRRNDTINLLAHVSDPVSMYRQAAVCILPTLEDGFGLVVLEAMACGKPVILTEHTGAKDCVRDKQDGFLIPPYQADAIADTLHYCYRHRSQIMEMGQHARQQAETFSWPRYENGIAHHIKRITGTEV